MATEISKLRRKRTTKRNTILKTTLPEVESLLRDEEKDTEELELDLNVRLEFLLEAAPLIKGWDVKIADLIDEDDTAIKDDEEAMVFNMKVNTAIKRIEKFISKRKPKDEENPLSYGRGYGTFFPNGEPPGGLGMFGGYKGPTGRLPGQIVENDGGRREISGNNSRGSSPNRNFQNRGVKLPKIKIKPFEGEIAEWKSFIDTFEAAVDSKDDLTDI